MTSLRDLVLSSSCFGYPKVPGPFHIVAEKYDQSDIPRIPGIYFAWRGGDVVYVGQSTNLRNRLTASHHILDAGEPVSWVFVKKEELNFAECFYIAALRPALNFGSGASNTKESERRSFVPFVPFFVTEIVSRCEHDLYQAEAELQGVGSE